MSYLLKSHANRSYLRKSHSQKTTVIDGKVTATDRKVTLGFDGKTTHHCEGKLAVSDNIEDL